MVKQIIKIAGIIIILFFFGFGIYSLFFGKVPKPIIKTKVEYITRVDTVKETIIKPPKIVYIDTSGPIIKYLDSIIYRSGPEPKKTTIEAQEYSTTLTSNNATAELQIITTGELLDVKGNIIYQEKNTTTESVIYKTNNCLYLYGETSIFPRLEEFKLGVDYTIKNKFIIGINAGYNGQYKHGSVNIKFGFNPF